MRIAVGSDERSHVTDVVVEELRRRGHQVETLGPLSGLPTGQAGEPLQWADVAREVAERVARGETDQGVLFCWTGTGVAIAANKVPGVRAALCWDAETARGARLWNDANVLCLSLRSTSEVIAREILEAWLSIEAPDPSEAENIEKVRALDRERARP
jgi:ribose 5-phosphate isomerase B